MKVVEKCLAASSLSLLPACLPACRPSRNWRRRRETLFCFVFPLPPPCLFSSFSKYYSRRCLFIYLCVCVVVVERSRIRSVLYCNALREQSNRAAGSDDPQFGHLPLIPSLGHKTWTAFFFFIIFFFFTTDRERKTDRKKETRTVGRVSGLRHLRREKGNAAVVERTKKKTRRRRRWNWKAKRNGGVAGGIVKN